MAVALEILLRFGGVAGEGHGEEPLLGDRLLRDFADAVGAVVDAFDRGLDFGERLLLVGDHAEGEVAVEGVGARVGHVLAVGREIAGIILGGALERLLRVALDALGEVRAQIDQELVVALEFLRHILVALEIGGLSLLGIEAEDVGERGGLHVLRLHLFHGGGRLGGVLGAGLGREGQVGLARDGLRDGADFFEAEGDGLGGRLALQDAVAQGGFLGRFFHGGRCFRWFGSRGRLGGGRPGWGRRGFFRDGFGGGFRRRFGNRFVGCRFLGGRLGFLFLGHGEFGFKKKSGRQCLGATRADLAVRTRRERRHPAPAARAADEA